MEIRRVEMILSPNNQQLFFSRKKKVISPPCLSWLFNWRCLRKRGQLITDCLHVRLLYKHWGVQSSIYTWHLLPPPLLDSDWLTPDVPEFWNQAKSMVQIIRNPRQWHDFRDEHCRAIRGYVWEKKKRLRTPSPFVLGAAEGGRKFLGFFIGGPYENRLFSDPWPPLRNRGLS